jgi:cytochrome oxidase Cu insertion factor (SCO1/SenC/PrrC family)
MKRSIAAGAALALLPLAPVATVMVKAQAKPEMSKISLKVGDVAPDFTLPSDQGKTIKLSDYRGKKSVLLAVYVLAFTGG